MDNNAASVTREMNSVRRTLVSHPQIVSRALAVLVVGGVIAIVCTAVFASPFEQKLRLAGRCLHNRQFALATRAAEDALALQPNHPLALLMMAEALAGTQEPDQAIDYYRRVPLNDSFESYRARLGLAVRLHFKGDMREAERHYRAVLNVTPDLPLANKRLADLLQIQGRTWEAIPPAMRIIRQGIFGATELHVVACPENRIRHDKRYLKLSRSFVPHQPESQLASARISALQNDVQAAEAAYREILEIDPQLPEAVFRFGRILIDSDRIDEFRTLDQQAAKHPVDHAGVWLNRGIVASRIGQAAASVRCFAEVLKSWPNHVEANYLLSQALASLGQAKPAQVFGERSRTLARIELTIPEFYDDPNDERMLSLLRDFEKMDRLWEAAAICEFAEQLNGPTPDWVYQQLPRLSHRLIGQEDIVVTPAPLDSIGSISDYPLPDWSKIGSSALATSFTQRDSGIRFRDVASETGLQFEYFNGSLSARGMEHIFETTGGGIASVDYDRDGWPDLYFTQGAPIWEGDDPVVHRDQLFRNRNGLRFESIAESAGLGDERFGQGVTRGDFDADGFPDLYVCNLGANRLYRNNGDGTFTDVTSTDVTSETSIAGDEWSLSCVLADFDNDGLQDLYVVNYLDKEAVFARRCRKNGAPLTCAPTLFPAEQDRVYRNLGDGRFEEVTDRCGVSVEDGKGLAVLAADFDGEGRISVFVGNDTTPNFLFENTSTADAPFRFEESGLFRGLAVDGEGRSQATMGIATGDVNGDGKLDLFVTDFFEDANTLFLNQTGGYFSDASRAMDLYQASYSMLGFGTEFLDADLDGRPDLFITNGHVDQSDATGEPDVMPAQFFWNQGEKFIELAAEELGPYFDRRLLGRTVSRLDWNRDGRDDLCVLGLYTPVSLLTNESDNETRSIAETGSIAIRLVGTSGDREAIGAKVSVVTADQTRTQQLVAGDGYMTSNERVLTFGVGRAKHVDVIVQWPGRRAVTHRGLPCKSEIVFVENGLPRVILDSRSFPP